MSRFIKAFPGSDEACCDDMERENVCDPCCTNLGCPDPPLYIAIDGYTDGMFGSSDVCPDCLVASFFADPVVWNGTFYFSTPTIVLPCHWQIGRFIFQDGYQSNPSYDCDGVDCSGGVSLGGTIDRIVDMDACIAYYLLDVHCVVAGPPENNCILVSDVRSATIGSAEDTVLGAYDGGIVIIEL